MLRNQTPVLLLTLAFLAPTFGQADATSRLKAGVDALQDDNYPLAIRELSAARPALPVIADYVGYWLAQAHAGARNHAAVAPALEPVWTTNPDSPLAGRAAVLAADSLLEQNDATAALRALARVPQEKLPQPQALAVLARAHTLARDLPAAAIAWQRVYYAYPLSSEADDARSALSSLRTSLADRYPPAMPAARLERADKLAAARQYQRARAEYAELAPSLGGLQREQALLRTYAMDYNLRRPLPAIHALRDLSLEHAEADAERLYWIAASYRRLDNLAGMMRTVEDLQLRAPSSPWRLKTLVLVANTFLVDNDYARFVPLYSACAESFPDSEEASVCHWKVVWRAHLERKPEAAALFQQHLARYPTSEKANAALFFLGRLAESRKDYPAARRYWTELETRFPNSYYGVLARDIVDGPPFSTAGPSPAADQFIQSVRWPERPRQADFTPDTATSRRIARARLLSSAGLDSWAEGELRYGARNGGRPWPLAMELAETATRRGAPDVALRHIKGTVPGYLWLPRDAAPEKFWKFAFPWPYRDRIERHCAQYGLDPYLVTALIRQESEFDPQAVSVARAIGLMQVVPSTGRALGRKIGIRSVTVASLKQPETNLRLGTYYLSRQLDLRNGNVEDTLAGYNAGPTRIPKWRSWGDFREAAEFVETVPLSQTREYVQIILRNADVYRWLYQGKPALYQPEPPPRVQTKKQSSPSKAKPAKASAKSPSGKTTKGTSSARKSGSAR